MVGQGNEFSSLISALFAMRLVTVCFLSFSSVEFGQSHYHCRILKVNAAIGNQLSISDFRHSHGVCDVPLGLHPYLRNGGRSCLEIKVEFHERAVPLSTLLALYWSHFACPLSLVWWVSYFLCSFCRRSNGAVFDRGWVSEGIQCYWRFVKLTHLTLIQNRRNLFCIQ